MSEKNPVGLLLGPEEDWPGAFESVMSRIGSLVVDGAEHSFPVERITVEPFNLRAIPSYSLVIDRLAHWYYVPREWLKKASVMNDVYLMNNPFTFQAMEKHTAYCAMMRLGLKVPETWMIPHKQPPENPRFPYTAAKYNRPFQLEDVAREIGYPLYMKPFDGGAWVGVTRVANDRELHRRYDESGARLMHVQAAIENFDVFARSLSIGAETMVVDYDPSAPLHGRYQVRHDFLTPELGDEVITISRLVNAFFRWEFNSCEIICKDGQAYPIDYANACPDMSLISLHYYFPWAIKSLAKWAIFCCATGRKMSIDQDVRTYFEIGDRGDLSYEEKLARYRKLAEEYFESERYSEFCDKYLAHVDEVAVEYIESREFDDLLVETVTTTFPANEHERFVAHYRGLLGAWASDQRAGAGA
ncbi:MAG: ATP-grasp domain-containing protein [Actinomycetota bacterium]